MFYCVFLDGHPQTRPPRREANTYELAAKRGDPMRRTAQSGAIGVGSAKHEIQPKRDTPRDVKFLALTNPLL